MKISTWRSWLAAAAIGLAATLPTQAAVLTFEDVLPTITAFGGSFNSGGYIFTDDNVGGFIGIDSAAAFDPSAGGGAAAPGNASGQFLYALNSAGFLMTQEGGLAFALSSFDAAFLSPVGKAAGVMPGQLFVDLFNAAGDYFSTEVFDLPAGTAGEDFPFATLTLSNKSAVLGAYFYTCSFQPTGECSFFGQSPFAQFAIDNIIGIPEPASVFLAMTALGVLVSRRRKTTAA